MPEAPQQVENNEAREVMMISQSISISDQVEQGQGELMVNANNTIERTMKISRNPKMNEALQLKGMENLLKYVSARAVVETRGLEATANKFSVRGKIGTIFKLKLEQEISGKFDAESVASGETAKLYKTKGEIATSLGFILGLEEYQGRDKTKPYFGYKLDGGNLKITFLGEVEIEEGEAEVNARLKLSYKVAEDMNLFADVTLSAVNKPDELGIQQLSGVLGISLPENQAIVLSANPGRKEAFLTYVGSF